MNVTAVMTSVDDNDNRRNVGQLNLSWEPPRMNYELFPVPSTYYVTIESRGVASRKQVRGPQHNMLTIANVNQDIETILK